MQSSARPFAPGPSLARSRPRQVSRFSRLITARSAGDRTSALRQLLNRPGILLGPAVFDGISARLTEQAGFDFAFLSGFSVAGARLGAPDTGLLSYAEMLDQGRNMHEATSSIPIIGDADTGYGNAMNVKRTVSRDLPWRCTAAHSCACFTVMGLARGRKHVPSATI